MALDPETLLRASCPLPDPEWVAGTERRLLPPARWRLARRRLALPRLRLRPALGGAVALTGVLLAFLLAGLAGSGPLAGDGGTSARARCVPHRTAPVPRGLELVKGSDGRLYVVRRPGPAARPVSCP